MTVNRILRSTRAFGLGVARDAQWRIRLLVGLLVSLLPMTVLAQEWVQPPRSQANIDALARVQVKTYKFAEAGNIDMEYRLYVPTRYDAARATPLVIALHGLGSGTSYMMEYNNLVELAERYGYIVATPLGYNPRGWYGAPVGWIDAEGNGTFAVAIRSAVSSGNIARLYAGAGIMARA